MGLIAVGVFMPFWGYLRNWSLWLDELLVAQQIIDRAWGGLFERLENGQNAPIGWLLAVKAAIGSAGASEFGLRLVPLLAGAAAVPVGWLAFGRLLGPVGALAALAVLALSWQTAAYGATVKQYSTDVLVAGLVLWSAARAAGIRPLARTSRGGGGGPRGPGFREPRPPADAPPAASVREPARPTLRSLAPLAILGLVVQWFSHPAVFMLGGAGLTLLIDAAARRRWRLAGGLAAMALAWIGVFLVHYFLFLRLDPTWEWDWLHAHWARRGGFMPWPIDAPADLLWLPRALNDAMAQATGLPGLSWIALAIGLAGARRLWRTDRRTLGIAGLPVVLTALAGALHRYPMADRLVLFLAPSMAVFLGAAVEWAWRLGVDPRSEAPGRAGTTFADRLKPGHVRAGLWIVLAPLVLTAGAWTAWPWMPTMEHTRPLFRVLAERHRPGEPVLLNYWARHAWAYYAPRFGLDAVEPVVAPREDEAPNKPAFGATVERLDDEPRLWLLLTHFARRPGDPPDEFTRHVTRRVAAVDEAAFGARLLRYDRPRTSEAE